MKSLKQQEDSRKFLNLVDYLDHWAKTKPNETAIVFPEKKSYSSVTFRELHNKTNSLALALKESGISEKSRVLMLTPPGADFIALWFSLLKIGATVILIDPGMGGKRLLKCIKSVEPTDLISIPKLFLIKKLLPSSFRSIDKCFQISKNWSFLGKILGAKDISKVKSSASEFETTYRNPSETSAIVFTTGSTGIPKGVVYSQKNMLAQRQLIQENFDINDKDIGFPAFLPFALFCISLGNKTIMPRLDPKKPINADPREMLELINKYQVTYSFGSPTFWNKVAEFTEANQLKFESLKSVLMFGAPVRRKVISNLKKILPNGQSFTPYGATEALPISSIDGNSLLEETLNETQKGKGFCVGAPLKGIEIKVIKANDKEIKNLAETEACKTFEIGEIICKGDVVSVEYFNLDDQTKLGKIFEGEQIWHRMGDVGYFDSKGRLWFCGRKNHRVITKDKTYYSVCVESIINQHPLVARSALVGINNGKEAAIVVELKKGNLENQSLVNELKLLASESEKSSGISKFLFHPSFPVDFRHNAKIIREELREWANKQ